MNEELKRWIKTDLAKEIFNWVKSNYITTLSCTIEIQNKS